MYNSLFPNNRYRAPFTGASQRERDEATKAARKNRGTSKPEEIGLAIVPNFYFSHGKWYLTFNKHIYSKTNELMAQFGLETLSKVEAMLTLYYAQKFYLALKINPRNEQSIKNYKVYDQNLNRWELNLSMHKVNSKPSRDLDLFSNQVINSIRMLIEQLDNYYNVMSEKNQKLAEKYKNKLAEQLDKITNKGFDLTPFHELAHPYMYENIDKINSEENIEVKPQ